MDFEQITISMDNILKAAGALITLSAATAIVTRMLSPFRKLKKQVEHHEQLLAKDKIAIDESGQFQRVIARALLATLDNSINGNNTEGLVRARDALHDYLTEK